MADDKMFITRLKTPDGQIHYLKDIEAHEILEGLAAVAMSGDYEDLLNKPIVDAEVSGSSTNAIQNKAIKTYVDNLIESLGTVLRYKGMKDTVEEIKTQTIADAGDVWICRADASEWICKSKLEGTADPTAWEEIGPIIDLSGYVLRKELGRLAFVDMAEGSFVPKGEIYVGDGEANYTPQGTIVGGEITVDTDETSVSVISDVGTLPTFSEGVFSAGTAADWDATVNGEMLEFSWTPNTLPSKEADSFDAGTLPTLAESVNVVTGVSATQTDPTFVGTGVNLAFAGTEGTVTVSAPYNSVYEKANIAALRLVADGIYNDPTHKNTIFDAPSYYYVKYCSGTTVPPQFAALGGADDTFKFSVGNNNHVEGNFWQVRDGEVYVAYPIILMEDMDGDELVVNGITSTNTSILTVERDTSEENEWAVTQDSTKPMTAYLKFNFADVETGDLFITKKTLPLKEGGTKTSYGMDKSELAFYPFGYSTDPAGTTSKYGTGEAKYRVAAIDSSKAVTMTLNYVMA